MQFILFEGLPYRKAEAENFDNNKHNMCVENIL